MPPCWSCKADASNLTGERGRFFFFFLLSFSTFFYVFLFISFFFSFFCAFFIFLFVFFIIWPYSSQIWRGNLINWMEAGQLPFHVFTFCQSWHLVWRQTCHYYFLFYFFPCEKIDWNINVFYIALLCENVIDSSIVWKWNLSKHFIALTFIFHQ